MKTLFACILALSLLLGLCGCQQAENETSDSIESLDTEEKNESSKFLESIDTEEETLDPSLVERLLSPDYVKSPYFDFDETDPSPTDAMISATIENIRSDRYESYPSLQTIPLSATLYKDGEVISIDVDDPRLIRLINFFNNALHYDKCHYLLCFVTEDILAEDVMSDDFRLELKFKPFGDVKPAPYDDNPSDFDTMIITNRFLYFTLINSTTPVYVGVKELETPFWGAIYGPYGYNLNASLSDFGF